MNLKLSTFAASLLLAGASLVSAQPVINSLYPPTLTEHSGDHVAFTVSATGSGTLAYQWYLNNTPLTGQTNAAIVLTNIQPAISGQYAVTVVDVSGTFVTNQATLNVSTNYLPIASSNLVVVRLGDGVQALSGVTGNTIYLDQYATNGAYVSTVQIPDTLPTQTYGYGTNKSIAGSLAVLLPGTGTDAVNQGVLTLSGNQQFLTLGGYQLAYPFTGTDVTVGGANYVRGIYTINAYGFPSLVYTNYGLYNGGNHVLRSVQTTDGTNFWTTGEAGSAGGVKYVSKTNTIYAGGSGVPTITSSLTGPRVVQIANGNLVFSDAANTNGHGLWAYGGLPEPAPSGNATGTQLVLNDGLSGLPNDFAISPDGATIYIADGGVYGGTNVQAGGIERWDNNGSGYVYSYTLAPTTGTNGAQNLTVYFPPSVGAWGPGVTGATIYATLSVTTNNTVVSVTDNGVSSVATPFIVAGPNQALRGLRFGPAATAVGVAITGQPQSQSAFIGNTVSFSVTAQGVPPFTYQWQFNGTNLPGANSSTLSLTNVQYGSAGSYSVIVSAPGAVATSSNAVLTVVSGFPLLTASPASRVETAGDHLAFAAQVTGTLPISYQWFYQNAPLANATNSALVLTNIQTGNAGSYFVWATNIFGAVTSAPVTLTVTSGSQFLAATNLVVARIGDGSQVLSAATGNTLYLDQYTTNGTYVSSIQVPDEGAGKPYGYGAGTNTSWSYSLSAGSKPLLVAGAGPDAPYEALLTSSADGASLNFAGYVQAYPDNYGDVTFSDETAAGNSTNNWRGIGGISAYGYYTLVDTNSGLYSGGNHAVHGAVTLEGVNFWTTGEAGSDGVKYLNRTVSGYATGIGIPQVASSGAGPRVAEILNGNLVYSDALATPPGLYVASGGGLPEPVAKGTALSSVYLNEGGSPVDFAVSPDGQTIYISDDEAFAGNNVQAGGIERWDSNGGGGFNYSYTLATGTNGVGARGLAVYFPTNITTWGAGVTGAILYATTAEEPENRLISVVDNGASSTATTLQYSGLNETFTGLRFGPALVAPGLYSNPTATNAFAGQTTTLSAIATGSTPFTYQWQLNGTNVAGATNASLTLSNLQSANGGSYTLVVSNGVNSVTSSPALLTVLALPQFTSTTNLGINQGFQLNFTGPAGYSYSIWSATNLAPFSVKSAWTKLVAGNNFNSGTNTYTDPNGGNSASQFYLITVP